MQKKVFDYMNEHHMVESGDRIIAGVSGGADSVALFCLLEEFRSVMDYELCVVHVNHNLRGEEARRDAEFVEKLCRDRHVEYALYSYDVEKLARERHLGTEEAGRQVRMEAFARQKEIWRGTKFALAHHQNDLAETMLHHLCRGTGIRGLCGIQPVQGEKIRPLLCVKRQEIERYLEERQISYVWDSSNDSDDYTRNRIRHQLLPVMEAQINEQTISHMARTAEHLRQIDEYLMQQAGELLRRHERKAKGGFCLAEAFFQEEKVLQEYALLELMGRVCGQRKDITSLQVRQALKLREKPVGKYIELPRGCQVLRQYDGIFVGKPLEPSGKNGKKTWELSVSQRLLLPEGSIQSRIFPYFGQEIPEKTYTKWLNYDKMGIMPQIRTRRVGDYLVVNHTGGRKKLKDYFIDCKIPKDKRDELLLVAIGSEILWVIGYRISEAYKVREDTKEVLELIYEGGKVYVREDQCYDFRGRSGR